MYLRTRYKRKAINGGHRRAGDDSVWYMDIYISSGSSGSVLIRLESRCINWYIFFVILFIRGFCLIGVC
jgi:hypothetical protein